MSLRSQVLAERLEEGARALAAEVASISDAEWQLPLPKDGRKIGVVVHHVANMYPLEMDLTLKIAAGNEIVGVTWDDVHAINAQHAKDNPNVTKEEALALLKKNSAVAAAQIRALSDAELDRGTRNSMYGDAPLTCQFFIEDHAMRHSFHHLAKIRAARGAQAAQAA